MERACDAEVGACDIAVRRGQGVVGIEETIAAGAGLAPSGASLGIDDTEVGTQALEARGVHEVAELIDRGTYLQCAEHQIAVLVARFDTVHRLLEIE